MEELLAIFCDVDDFCNDYEDYCQHHLLMDKEQIVPKTSMSLSEIMKMSIVPLTLYLMKYRVGKCTGINFIDSTTLDVCDTHRIYSHKVFKNLAQRGKSSTGWFYGFKLHLVINDMGEILSVFLTSGNVDDRDWNVIARLTKELYGKLSADRGYLSQKLFEKLLENNIHLITKLKKNMKNKLVNFSVKLLLRRRAVIESVNDFLKNICQIEHSRHRSVDNFFFSPVISCSKIESILSENAGIVSPKCPQINFRFGSLSNIPERIRRII